MNRRPSSSSINTTDHTLTRWQYGLLVVLIVLAFVAHVIGLTVLR